MLAGTTLGVAGANIGNLAASHLPFASYLQPCASYRLFFRQPSPSHRGWKLAYASQIASSCQRSASRRQPPEPAYVQPVPSPFPALCPVTPQRSASRIFLLGPLTTFSPSSLEELGTHNLSLLIAIFDRPLTNFRRKSLPPISKRHQAWRQSSGATDKQGVRHFSLLYADT